MYSVCLKCWFFKLVMLPLTACVMQERLVLTETRVRNKDVDSGVTQDKCQMNANVN